MDKKRIIRSDDWAVELLKALGLDHTKNRRVIIDCEAGYPIKIYLESFGDERLWDVRMPPLEVVQIVEPKVTSDAD